ncbi:Bbp19 family protein [Pseudomonas sp. NUPR-001]|uniref:Bbp19 family protein n=1 Tax=Pseudomonas sp. NUPR-001 TaxID=3416058 RepID=UPI003F9760D0
MFEDAEILQQREDAARLEQEQAAQDFKWLMADPRGRRLTWKQLEAARVFHPVYDPKPIPMAFSEGKRQHGLYLLQRINTLCPHLYQVMVAENTTVNSEE